MGSDGAATCSIPRKSAESGYMLPTSRYPSDLTDSQWALIERLPPPPAETGRPEEHPRRNIVDRILYVAWAGGSWRQLPGDYPPWQTVYWHFARWEKSETRLCCFDPVVGEAPVGEPFVDLLQADG